MHVTSLYICPWSLQDPLCQSQSLSYLYGLTSSGHKIALITFENPKFALSSEETTERKKQLETKSIYWYPVAYHQGQSLKAKALDNYNGIVTGLKAWRQHKPRIVHSRSSLPTLIAVALSKISRMKFLYDADSVLSEEYADNGHWSRNSWGFKAMAAAENLARRNADRVIVLTKLLKRDFQIDYKVEVPIDVIPCCVDTEKFRFNSEARENIRRQLGVTDNKLLVYVGKTGGRYLVEEMFDFFKAAQSQLNSLRLLIISQEAPEIFHQIAGAKEISSDLYLIRQAQPTEVSAYLSAADAGLAFIKSVNSERGSSPIKVAEYLSVGLPVVITDKIGDCSQIIKENKVGIVVSGHNNESYLKATAQLSRMWEEDISVLSARSTHIAEEFFSLERVGIERYRQIYQKLL